MFDLFSIKGFLDATTREDVVAELRLAGGGPATVYGQQEAAGTVEPLVRKATRVVVSPETHERVRQQLLNRREAIEAHFSITVSECEELQFLRYQTGGYFVAHQDGNTPLIFDDSRLRKISIVIFLNSQSVEALAGTYGGGELTLHGKYPNYSQRFPVEAEPGTLVAFRAETTHEVTPVLHGERYTVVSWFR